MSRDPMTLSLCEAYRGLAATGGDVTSFVGEWARMLNVQRPAIWRRLRSGGALPPYNSSPRGGFGPRPKRVRVRVTVESLPPRVDRDPCPRCGVRADVGCNHGYVRSLGVLFG